MSIQNLLAILITVMMAAIGVLFAFKPPDAANQILTGLIGTVSTVFVMVYAFYFGSSSGSKEKDDTVKQIALGNTPAALVAEDKPTATTKLTSVSSG